MKSKLHEKVEIVYEDTDVVVIEKAAGVITYPLEEREKDSAIQLIRQFWKFQGKSNQHLYLIHRLDKETSGLLVFAKTTRARESLLRQFEEHSVIREYIAVTEGIPRRKKGEIKTLLGHDRRGRRAVSHRGKLAITRYEVLQEDRVHDRALVSCRLETGRTHQIRIHLAHINAPVLGDGVYGRERSGRLALHALALGFLHPGTRRPIVLRSSVPPELRSLISKM